MRDTNNFRCISRNYWNQFLGKILYYTIPANEPSDTIRYMTKNSHARKVILLLGLMGASVKDAGVPNLDLSRYRMMKTKLRKSRDKDDMLKICKLRDLELRKVRYVLEILPSYLINKGDTNLIILYNGCPRIATGFRDDFVEGNLVHLCHPHLMDGIGNSLESTH